MIIWACESPTAPARWPFTPRWASCPNSARGASRRAVGLINDKGVRINLIFNGQATPDGRNVLMDVAEKWPGWTHPAFVVSDLDSVLKWARSHDVAITEGPGLWGRRRVCFLRDPDGNVLEFDELLASVPADTAA